MDPVFAYIDVGAGSLMTPALVAALIAAPIALRHQIARLTSRFRTAHRAGTHVASAADGTG